MPFTAAVRGREQGDNPRGLALLVVTNPPAGVRALPVATHAEPMDGEKVTMAGFPRNFDQLLAPETTIAGHQGQDLTLSIKADEGYSGGPVLRGGSVIGIVYSTEEYGFALLSDVVKIYLGGLKVPLGGEPASAEGSGVKVPESAWDRVGRPFSAPNSASPFYIESYKFYFGGHPESDGTLYVHPEGTNTLLPVDLYGPALHNKSPVVASVYKPIGDRDPSGQWRLDAA